MVFGEIFRDTSKKSYFWGHFSKTSFFRYVLNIINSRDNEGKKFEKINIKSPNQTAKIFYNKKSNFINNNISKISKSNSLYKDKNKYKSFPFNYKKTNTNIDSKDNNNN